jgi:hypothetical protein
MNFGEVIQSWKEDWRLGSKFILMLMWNQTNFEDITIY